MNKVKFFRALLHVILYYPDVSDLAAGKRRALARGNKCEPIFRIVSNYTFLADNNITSFILVKVGRKIKKSFSKIEGKVLFLKIN